MQRGWVINGRHDVVVVASMVALLVVAVPAQAAFPGRNGEITFVSGFHCDFEEYAIGMLRPDGSERRQVTDCGSTHYAPSWSPDGASMLFGGSGAIWQAAADGSGVRKVTAGSFPSFAPDGRHVVYNRGVARREIWRARTDGSHPRRLRARTRFSSRPLWSPQGRTITYAPYRKGLRLISSRTGRLVRRLTSAEMLPLDWSPDGEELLCKRATSTADSDIPIYDLYIVKADGTRPPRRLTRTRDRSEGSAAWSPNGRRMVVVFSSHLKSGLHRTTVMTMSTRATDRHRIWRTPPYDPYDDSGFEIVSPADVAWQPLPR